MNPVKAYTDVRIANRFSKIALSYNIALVWE